MAVLLKILGTIFLIPYQQIKNQHRILPMMLRLFIFLSTFHLNISKAFIQSKINLSFFPTDLPLFEDKEANGAHPSPFQWSIP
jgi:hypothetical protein